ncbi:hypothetical protein BGY98DRAFT_1099345 [Russula aff. rugulosa BPL654]|nr:hypothetical protein BGY98DRAFT_1099345 [Russula aff. rugulosa BPL654]
MASYRIIEHMGYYFILVAGLGHVSTTPGSCMSVVRMGVGGKAHGACPILHEESGDTDVDDGPLLPSERRRQMQSTIHNNNAELSGKTQAKVLRTHGNSTGKRSPLPPLKQASAATGGGSSGAQS